MRTATDSDGFTLTVLVFECVLDWSHDVPGRLAIVFAQENAPSHLGSVSIRSPLSNSCRQRLPAGWPRSYYSGQSVQKLITSHMSIARHTFLSLTARMPGLRLGHFRFAPGRIMGK